MSPRSRILTLVLLFGGLAASLSSPAHAQEAAPPAPPAAAPAPKPAPAEESYVRAREDEGGVLRLELATRVFEPAAGSGARIHLVSAIHVADASFYATRQAELDGLGLVLFEGVKPTGAGTIDAGASEARKSSATRARLGLLRELAEKHRAEAGSFPADVEALAAAANRRWTSIMAVVLRDGWGRPIRYRRRAPVEGPGGTPEGAVLESDGPDGKPDSALENRAVGGEPGDDIALAFQAGAAAPPQAPGIQAAFAKALGITFQLDAMDSGRANWHSSDMSLDELQERMDAAGADASELFALLDGNSFNARMLGYFLNMVSKNPKMAALVKTIMVEMLGSDGAEAMMGMQGGGPGSAYAKNMAAVMRVVIEDRNAVVLRDLRDVLAKEPQVKDVAIFYGAGHMKDMERHLVADFGYRPATTAWTPALRVDPRDAGLDAAQAKAVRTMFRKMADKALEGK